MKIRSGFVSNSSTSSFCVFGILLKSPNKFLNSILGEPKTTKTPGCKHEMDRENVKFCPECGKKAWNVEVEDRDGISEYEKEIMEKTGLEVIEWYGGEGNEEGTYLGKSLESWEKGLTAERKLEILKETREKIAKLFPTEEPDFYSDAAYNG